MDEEDENPKVDDSCDFVCDNRICMTSLLGFPFHFSKFDENDKINPFAEIFPCKKCGIDCADDCVQCDKCNGWIYYDCAKLTDNKIEFYNVPENQFFCCKRCESAPLTCPPHLDKKINSCVTSDNCTSEFTLNPAAAPFIPGSKHTSDLNSEVSKVTLENSSSQDVDSTSKNASEQLGTSSLPARANIAKSHDSIYFHKFLEIKCSYLCPNDQ